MSIDVVAEHTGWFDWVLSSAVTCVYAFGMVVGTRVSERLSPTGVSVTLTYARERSCCELACSCTGMILMTPQLFINYKLQSVAHLPWRFLGYRWAQQPLLCHPHLVFAHVLAGDASAYRFMNTFIDDVFAFIIKMPMLHRLR